MRRGSSDCAGSAASGTTPHVRAARRGWASSRTPSGITVPLVTAYATAGTFVEWLPVHASTSTTEHAFRTWKTLRFTARLRPGTAAGSTRSLRNVTRRSRSPGRTRPQRDATSRSSGQRQPCPSELRVRPRRRTLIGENAAPRQLGPHDLLDRADDPASGSTRRTGNGGTPSLLKDYFLAFAAASAGVRARRGLDRERQHEHARRPEEARRCTRITADADPNESLRPALRRRPRHRSASRTAATRDGRELDQPCGRGRRPATAAHCEPTAPPAGRLPPTAHKLYRNTSSAGDGVPVRTWTIGVSAARSGRASSTSSPTWAGPTRSSPRGDAGWGGYDAVEEPLPFRRTRRTREPVRRLRRTDRPVQVERRITGTGVRHRRSRRSREPTATTPSSPRRRPRSSAKARSRPSSTPPRTGDYATNAPVSGMTAAGRASSTSRPPSSPAGTDTSTRSTRRNQSSTHDDQDYLNSGDAVATRRTS